MGYIKKQSEKNIKFKSHKFINTVAAAIPAFATINNIYASEESIPAKPPNIVYIFADQMRAHVLGCYGNKVVPTPNFDAMASAGMVFDNAISTYPVCSPYRAMLLSGRYPIANGTIANDTAMRRDIPTIATTCKEQGYDTGYIGKWHLESNRIPFVPKNRRLGFDYWAVNNCTHNYIDHFYCTDTPEKIYFKGYDAFIQTGLAIDYIKKKKKDKPFCLFMSWGPPHNPYNRVPDEYKKRIPIESIKLRENVKERAVVDNLMAWDKASDKLKKRRAKRRKVLEDDEILKREYIQGYYAHTAALDDCIGKLRQALKEAGIADNTILVFSSDHGDMLGSHRMASKQSPLEESIRIPLIVEFPKSVPKGKRSDALVAPIDIMPTLLSLAGLKCPDVDGKDLADAARGRDSNQQDAVLLMKLLPGGNPYNMNGITPWRGVRTKRYTYANLLGHGPWLLYDNLKDPYQMDNLIGKPEYAELQAGLEKRMRELMRVAGDPGDTEKIAKLKKPKLKMKKK